MLAAYRSWILMASDKTPEHSKSSTLVDEDTEAKFFNFEVNPTVPHLTV